MGTANSDVEAATRQRRTATVTLDEPFKRGETTIAEVTLTEPRGGALRGLSLAKLLNESEYDEHVKLIPRISTPQITKQDFDTGNIAPSDIMQLVGESCGFFLPKAKRQEYEEMAADR